MNKASEHTLITCVVVTLTSSAIGSRQVHLKVTLQAFSRDTGQVHTDHSSSVSFCYCTRCLQGDSCVCQGREELSA